MEFLRLIYVVILHVCLVAGGRRGARTSVGVENTSPFGQCSYQGYRPGGDVTTIATIQPPTLELKTVSNVVEGTNKALEIAPAVLEVAAVASKTVAAVAPTLGPVLGIFGALFGAITSGMELTPEEVAQATDRAMAKLTNDINNNLDKLQGYVDSTIVTTEKNLITREYMTAFRMWSSCVVEPSKERSNECQRDAYRYLSASRPKYAVFSQEVQANTLTGLQTREVEVYLLLYRDYVNLLIMELKPLIMTYCDGSQERSAEDKIDCRNYCNALKAEITYAKTYTEDAIRDIIAYHRKGACTATDRCSMTTGRRYRWEEFPVGKFSMQRRKVWYDIAVGNCQCTMDYGTRQICQMTVNIDTNGKFNYPTYQNPSIDMASDSAVANAYGKNKLQQSANAYQAKDVEIVTAYWQKEVLDFVPLWDKAYEFAASKANAQSDEFISDDRTPKEFSPRFLARLEAAMKDGWNEYQK